MEPINQVDLVQRMHTLVAQSQGDLTAKSTDFVAFKEVFSKALSEVNDLQKTADTLRTSFDKGDPNIDLSDVMIATQKSSLAFEMVLQVRNRLVSAYQEIMNMPI